MDTDWKGYQSKGKVRGEVGKESGVVETKCFERGPSEYWRRVERRWSRAD